jgi:hypothetical protein
MKRMVALVALAATGCSLVLVEKPHVEAGKVACTDSMKFPAIDAGIGIIGIGMPFLLEAMRDRSVDKVNWPLYIGLWGAGAVGAISSVVGYRKVSRCRAALAAPAP